MKQDIYTMDGKKSGQIDLPEHVFGVTWNNALMYQVVTSMEGNARTPVAHTKDRGDVRGGGKKPWQQKGTGRARHGSIRSPIWKGGGVAHGPRNEKVYAREIPKKMRAKALYMALSRKLKDGQLLFVDALGFDKPKTAQAARALKTLAGIKGFEKLSWKRNAALIAAEGMNDAAQKSFRNIGSVRLEAVANLNPALVLKYKYLIIENPASSLKSVEKRLPAPKAKAENAAK